MFDRQEATMAKRVLLAGVLGGIAMFAWSSVAHTVLPLGRTGVQEIPNEQGVLSAMQAQLGATSGLYMYPGMGLGPNPTQAQENAAMPEYEKKLASNPSGLLIYHPPGSTGFTPRKLGTEFVTELMEAMFVAFLLAQTTLGGFLSRVGFVALIGIIAAITTNIPYWNWYGFPSTYTAGYMTIEIVGYLVAGLVAAAIVKRERGGTRNLAAAA
jgi:hypothetical protein